MKILELRKLGKSMQDLETTSCIFLLNPSPLIAATNLSPSYSSSTLQPPVHSPLGQQTELHTLPITTRYPPS